MNVLDQCTKVTGVSKGTKYFREDAAQETHNGHPTCDSTLHNIDGMFLSFYQGLAPGEKPGPGERSSTS
jgi:hypothetical protein